MVDKLPRHIAFHNAFKRTKYVSNLQSDLKFFSLKCKKVLGRNTRS